jgi:hypothetical protein
MITQVPDSLVTRGEQSLPISHHWEAPYSPRLIAPDFSASAAFSRCSQPYALLLRRWPTFQSPMHMIQSLVIMPDARTE